MLFLLCNQIYSRKEKTSTLFYLFLDLLEIQSSYLLLICLVSFLEASPIYKFGMPYFSVCWLALIRYTFCSTRKITLCFFFIFNFNEFDRIFKKIVVCDTFFDMLLNLCFYYLIFISTTRLRLINFY